MSVFVAFLFLFSWGVALLFRAGSFVLVLEAGARFRQERVGIQV